MVQRVATVAFEGIEARAVDVQVQVAPGLPALQPRRPAGQGGVGGARAGALGADHLGPRASGAPHHGQPRAGRPAEGRQPLRPADRARADGGDRRDPARCTERLHGAWRARPRRIDRAGGRRAAGRDRRQRPRRGIDLPRRLRLGSGLGEPRHADHRRQFADPARQPFQGHAGAVAAAAGGARGGSDVARPARHQGPGERQARARDRGRRRPSPADDRQLRAQASRCWRRDCPRSCRRCRHRSCSKSR